MVSVSPLIICGIVMGWFVPIWVMLLGGVVIVVSGSTPLLLRYCYDKKAAARSTHKTMMYKLLHGGD